MLEPSANRTFALLLIGVSLWCGFIFLAPWLKAQGSPAASVLYGLFHLVCHQFPERSFTLNGAPLAVCHRCLGIYFGFGIGLLLSVVLHQTRLWLLHHPRFLIVFLVPLGIDLLIPNNALSRFSSGLFAGLPMAVFVWTAVHQATISLRAPAIPNRQGSGA